MLKRIINMLQGDGESGSIFRPKIIDRYVAREFLVSYLISLAVILSLRVLIDMFMFFDEFVEDQAGETPGAMAVVGYILSYYVPKLFEFFRDFSGMIILMAASFSLVRMTRQNELTAILASGISLKRVIAPIILIGMALNIVMVFDQELILPRMADKLTRRPDEMGELRQVRFKLLPDRDTALVTGRYDPQSQMVYNMFVILRQDGQMIGKITADEAQWDDKYKVWKLVNGIRFGYGDDVVEGTKALVTKVSYYESDLTPEYLWLQRNSSYKSLMSSGELTQLLRRELKPVERAEALSEKHFRFTDPIINMVMLLLGLPMLVSRERRSTKTAMFLAMACAGGCFVATFGCKLLAGGDIYVGDDFKRLLLAWLPIIVFLPVSVLTLDGIKT